MPGISVCAQKAAQVKERGEANEVYKIRQFGFKRILYLYGMHGFWGCGKRAAFLDA